MKNILSVLILSCFVLFYSCRVPKYVYSPSTANLIVPEGKGNFKAAANYTSAASVNLHSTAEKHRSNGADLQTVYGINDRIAIRADLFTKKETESQPTPTNQGNQYLNAYHKNGAELSAGFYKLSQTKTSTLQLFAGLGYGRFTLDQSIQAPVAGNYYHKMNYVKAFFQPSLRLQPSENFAITFADKLSVFNFNHVMTNLPDIDKEPLGMISTKHSVFNDLVFHMEFGFRGLNGVKFQMQTGYSKLLTNFFPGDNVGFSVRTTKYDYNNIWFAGGIVTDINKLFIKK